MHAILPSVGVQIARLVIRKLGVNEMVQHSAQIRKTDRFAVVELEFKILWEHPREHTSNPIRVQFEGGSNLLDQGTRHLDDRGSCQACDSRHLHRIPPCAPAHEQ
jgi:hypothetical protein